MVGNGPAAPPRPARTALEGDPPSSGALSGELGKGGERASAAWMAGVPPSLRRWRSSDSEGNKERVSMDEGEGDGRRGDQRPVVAPLALTPFAAFCFSTPMAGRSR